ncbi:hypothetical protein [Nitrosomonas sp. Nm51]|uniref:hypothetical protein n=1 Tax=Nitrosomonas sp. Nm51 TaxID=133720 RepID=UPI0015A5013B|nr:hypothetical protein [Nitrosomonas sp. Nm51]
MSQHEFLGDYGAKKQSEAVLSASMMGQAIRMFVRDAKQFSSPITVTGYESARI